MNQQFVVITPAMLQSEPMPLFFERFGRGQREPC
jgi:hypothetical protein